MQFCGFTGNDTLSVGRLALNPMFRSQHTQRLKTPDHWQLGVLNTSNNSDNHHISPLDLRYIIDLHTWERKQRQALLASIHDINVHRRDVQTSIWNMTFNRFLI